MKLASLSARRAWIEITLVQIIISGYARSLSARRAWIEIRGINCKAAETAKVALRKESVDRNHVVLVVPSGCWLSLSARRAWIEIIDDLEPSSTRKSLSARRAWIEISRAETAKTSNAVALRKESVDRNLTAMQIVIIVVGRSPQGERG